MTIDKKEGKAMLFDTHAHYDNPAFREDREALLKALPGQGVGLVLCPGSDVESSRRCIAMAEKHRHVYAAVGVHPQEAAGQLPSYLDALSSLLSHPKVKAVGEIGLDYFYDEGVPHPVQQAVLHSQLSLAAAHKLPVILHDRDAHGDMLSIMRQYPHVRGVFHCYSGSLALAKELVAMGHSLSFTGTITFKNARKGPEVIAWLPLERIMIETDAPYMAPTPFRGKRNHSGYVYRMAEAIAEIKHLPLEEVIEQTTKNGKKFFAIGEENT